MKMRKRKVRSRVRKRAARRTMAAARKRRISVARRIRRKFARKPILGIRPVRRKRTRRRVISGKLAEEHIRNLILQVAGEKAIAVAEALEEPLSDEDLANACRIKLSEVRAVLNKLHSLGLTSYERTRDKDSGWYSYIWRMSLQNADKLFEKKKELPLKEVGEESFDFYSCSSCKKGEGVLIPFEVAFENKFKCLDCGAPLAFVEKKKEISK
jgi:transcription initiation factor TFIIE subunit alpha